MGHASTLDYVAEAAGAVLAHTGLLPHVNAGVASQADLARLRRVSASQARACWLIHTCQSFGFALLASYEWVGLLDVVSVWYLCSVMLAFLSSAE